MLRIKEIMKLKDVSQVELADGTGVSRTTIYRILKDDTAKTSDLIKIATYLDVDIRDLFVSTKHVEKGIKESLIETRDSIDELISELNSGKYE